MKKLFKIIFLISLLGFSTSLVYGYVASSSSYILQSDSINFGGGKAGSASYNGQDTLGEVGTGVQNSSNYKLNAGYQATIIGNSFIGLSSSGDVSLSPSISDAGGGTSDGTSGWIVTTDNPAGYSLSVKALNYPALSGSAGSFSDYTPSYADPDYNWAVPNTESRFGFSPEGNDIVAKYRDDGVSCNHGSFDSTAKCWNGFSTTDEVIAESNHANYPVQATTTLRLRAQVGSSKTQPAGSYSAQIVVTAVSL